jgi:hypothetical protein
MVMGQRMARYLRALDNLFALDRRPTLTLIDTSPLIFLGE